MRAPATACAITGAAHRHHLPAPRTIRVVGEITSPAVIENEVVSVMRYRSGLGGKLPAPRLSIDSGRYRWHLVQACERQPGQPVTGTFAASRAELRDQRVGLRQGRAAELPVGCAGVVPGFEVERFERGSQRTAWRAA